MLAIAEEALRWIDHGDCFDDAEEALAKIEELKVSQKRHG
jgi:hypothetical protein